MMQITNFTLPGPEEDGKLTLAFSRCRPRQIPTQARANGRRFALFALHAVGSHKEAWFPTVEELFKLQQMNTARSFVIEEFWSMDCPNHGQSAVYNDARLHELPDGLTGPQCARAAHKLLTSGLISRGTTLVGLGHSAGACVIIHTMESYPLHRLPFFSLILVEPTMMTRKTMKEFSKNATMMVRSVEAVKSKKDIWPSREAAREWMSHRSPWKRWDPRVLEVYLKYALCDLPTSKFPDVTSGVTLATPREHEVAGYGYPENGFTGLERLIDICRMKSVHAVYAATKDFIPGDMQLDTISEKAGRRMASVATVPNSGHLVVQENPHGLARAIWEILCADDGPSMSKL